MSDTQSINELLDTIEEIMEEGTSMPLTGGKRLVDVNQVRDCIDHIRLNMPGQIRQAEGIVSDRAQITADAHSQADEIVRRAEERARVLVSDSQVVKAAEQKAAEIIAEAQKQSREMQRAVTEYCENVLRSTEETMTRHLTEVKSVRTSLRQNASSQK